MSFRPLALLAIAFALGILAADRGIPCHPVSAGLALAIALPIGRTRHRLVGLRPLARALASALVMASAGHLALSLRQDVLIDPLPPGTVACGGRVSSVRPISGGRAEVRIRRGFCRSATGSVRVGLVTFVDSGAPSDGDVVSLRGALQVPSGPRNPGDVDRRRVERRRGFSAVLRPDAGGAVRVLRPAGGRARSIARLRRVLRRRVVHQYGEDVEPVVRALLLGDPTGISEEARSDFRRAGLSHLLAVSGLHVAVLAGVVLLALSSLLARLPFPPAARSVLTALAVVVVLAGLLAVVGPRPSVARASAMGALIALRHLLQRSGPALRDVLALAFLTLLSVDPAWLFEAGFQLSHAAVLGLSFTSRSGGWLRSGIRASCAATAATAPLVAWHFGPVPLAGALTNLLGVPLTAVAVTSGMLGLLPRAGPVVVACEAAVRLLLVVARHGARALGWVRLVVAPGQLPAALAAVTGACLLARSRRGRFVASAAALAVALTTATPRLLRIVFLDVGQGDATVLHLPDGRTALIDTGTAFGSAPSRYLARLGIDRLDLVVVTHDHADHAGGLDRLLREAAVARVASSVPLGVPGVRLVSAGDTLGLGPDLRLFVLSPAEAGRGNEASLALVLEYGTRRVLFLGDVEEPAERVLVAAWPRLLRSDVIQVGHHGARTSSSRDLVSRAVSMGTLAVVSVGARNRYGHPDARIMGRWAGAGARVWDTSRLGAACVVSDGRTIVTGCR